MIENVMRYYSDLEIELLIDEITLAAYEAIELAAGEAAKAAILSMLEKEAAALREVQRWRVEAQNNFEALQTEKSNGKKNALIAVLIGVISGLFIGVGGTVLMSN